MVVTAIAAAAIVSVNGQGPARTETDHLVVTTSTIPGAGGRVSLVVDVVPKPKMHVYSPEQKDVVPISLKLDPGDFKTQPAVLPKAEKYFFKPLNETQFVYSKPFRIVQPVTLGPAAAKRPVPLTGSLRYQACDDAICYVPVTVPLVWTIGARTAAR